MLNLFSLYLESRRVVGKPRRKRKPWQSSALRHEKSEYIQEPSLDILTTTLLDWGLMWLLWSLCPGSCLRHISRSVLLSFQSLIQRRSFPRPPCRAWPPHQDPSWRATGRRDAIPLVRHYIQKDRVKVNIGNFEPHKT